MGFFDSLKAFGVNRALDYLKKDPETNIPKLMNLINKFAPDDLFPAQRAAFDKAIADGAKNADRSCIRLVAARGVYEAFPSVMQAIKDNKERGDACWVVEKMGMENDFLTICELAVETKDNWLCGRILPIASNVAKRISNPEPVMAKLEQLKAKAEAAGVKAPWDRAIEMVKYKGVLPKKR